MVLSEGAPSGPPLFYVNGLQYPQNTNDTIYQAVLNTVEEWLVAVTNDPSTFLEPHVYHLHTNDFLVTGQGAWDYQKGVLNYTSIKANGTTRDYGCRCMLGLKNQRFPAHPPHPRHQRRGVHQSR